MVPGESNLGIRDQWEGQSKIANIAEKPSEIVLALVAWTITHGSQLQAAEYVDGPANRTIRDGMHSCRVGYYAVGIH